MIQKCGSESGCRTHLLAHGVVVVCNRKHLRVTVTLFHLRNHLLSYIVFAVVDSDIEHAQHGLP